MAIDTLKIKKYISESDAKLISENCILRQAINLKDGNLEYEITSGTLSGSYDSRISIRVNKDIDFYVLVECSLHKILLGHNVFGGTNDLLNGILFINDILNKILGVEVFKDNNWYLMRIDLAEIYDLKSFEACQDWFKGLNTCDYPRRKVSRFGLESVCAYGSTTSFKAYHKGPEFWKHDRRRLRDLDYEGIDDLQEKANNIIRVEVGLKGRKIKQFYGGEYPLIENIKVEDLYSVYDREVGRFLKEGLHDMKIVRKTHDVRNRLFNIYSDTLASSVLATWYQLTTLGEDSVKKSMKKTKYYSHIKYLKEAGISWHGTDIIMLENSLVPEDFSPVRTDRRRITGEAPELSKKLNHYRIAI